MSLNYRTLWISDVHLGTSACRAEDLLEFLDAVTADKIFLVGDIIDLERMETRAVFPDSHRQVLARILQLSQSGTEVVYIPGNHDYQMRQLVGRDILGVPVMFEASHVRADGHRMLVKHGDLLDAEIRQGSGLGLFGASAYRVLVNLDVAVNKLRSRLGRQFLSVSANVKARLASADEYIRQFEQLAARHAADRGFDGIVCGHIHQPRIRYIDGIHYANDGDWVESRTAIGETKDGVLEVLRWQEGSVATESTPVAARKAA